MHTTKARNVFRVVAVLLASVGLANLSVAIPFDARFGTFGVILSCIFALLGFYFLYVAYRCWWQLSPRVVRHICAAGAFYLLGGVSLVLQPITAATSEGVGGVLALITFIGALWIYFRASRYVVRLVFGEQTVQSVNQ